MTSPLRETLRLVAQFRSNLPLGVMFDFISHSHSGNHQGFYDPDGTLQSRKVQALSRSYALATAGQYFITWNTLMCYFNLFNTPTPAPSGLIERLNFDDTTGTFVLEYTYVPSGNTVIYLSQDYHYPNGFNVYATDGLSFQKYPNYLEVTHPRTMPTGTPVHVLITAH